MSEHVSTDRLTGRSSLSAVVVPALPDFTHIFKIMCHEWVNADRPLDIVF